MNDEAKGKAKEAYGALTGDESKKEEGQAQQKAGKAAEDAKQKAKTAQEEAKARDAEKQSRKSGGGGLLGL